MTEPEYDLNELYDAYLEHASPYSGDPYCPWSLFKETYGENAERHFRNALHNGDIKVKQSKPGITADGKWPKIHAGNAWLKFDF